MIYWLPRWTSVGFVVFLSLFSLDIFSEYSGWDAVVPLFIHLIPAIVLLILALAAWRHDLTGACAFIGFAILYVFVAGPGRPWTWYAAISGPSFIVGILYLLSWLQKKKIPGMEKGSP